MSQPISKCGWIHTVAGASSWMVDQESIQPASSKGANDITYAVRTMLYFSRANQTPSIHPEGVTFLKLRRQQCAAWHYHSLTHSLHPDRMILTYTVQPLLLSRVNTCAVAKQYFTIMAYC
jgi:hypothetical protein